MNLNERIEQLEKTIAALEQKVRDLSLNTEGKSKSPNTIGGNIRSSSMNFPVDPKTGLGAMYGNAVIWNDSELKTPILNGEPTYPVVGFNKHSHSRFSGGALIKDVLEIVEYDWGTITNKHSQGYLNLTENDIVTVINSKDEPVKKIGLLDLVFNADTLTWGASAYEIDVKKCYLVERDEDGNIALDENDNEKKSLLFNEDTTKSSVVWDKNAQVWRFYATYAPEPEEE
jgi:hypothetical protein